MMLRINSDDGERTTTTACERLLPDPKKFGGSTFPPSGSNAFGLSALGCAATVF
jgi:hypothetical protein